MNGSPTQRLLRRAHLGLDLARPGDGCGLELMDLPRGSPLAGRVSVGARLLAIDDVAVPSLDAVRERVRALRVGSVFVLEFDSGRVSLRVPALPLEPVEGGEVELSEVDCGPYALRAIWTFPRGQTAPSPTVWMLPSANWLSEEHVQEPWHPTLKLVQALNARGFATLRVDRSGVGDSGGPPCTGVDLETELRECRRAAAHLLSHPRVDRNRWFPFGRSLGGVLVLLLAAELQPKAAAVWGSTCRPWYAAMLASAQRQLELAGLDAAEVGRRMALRQRLYQEVYLLQRSPGEVLEAHPELRRAEARELAGDRIHGRVARYFHQVAATDVAAACRALRGKLLVMRGSLDWLTSEDDARAMIAAAPRATLRTFAGVDHLMHRRDGTEEAFLHVFGGEFDPCGADAMAEFFGARGADRD